ncbi:TetR/AcrR family transcriptional regulator [Brevibacillus choshinensis]|uniref:TetR/AcrR family transcriptional regulator n=2 Tax=Brevibacillus choshinensis TaxID=54911 RepID=UPI002EA65E94|nr:TetR/AcrR family transcriptional regulator [Brevibacillus choshinensis]
MNCKGGYLIRIDKKDQIIDQAVKIFGELGFYKTTTAQVAKAAGVTQPYIFHFFKNKEELFIAVLDRAVMRMKEGFSRVEGSADSIIHNMGKTFQSIMATHRDEVLLVMQAHTIAETQIREHTKEVYRKIHRTIAERFQTAGVSNAEVEAARFIATGQFIVVIEVLDVPEMYCFKNEHKA